MCVWAAVLFSRELPLTSLILTIVAAFRWLKLNTMPAGCRSVGRKVQVKASEETEEFLTANERVDGPFGRTQVQCVQPEP